MISSEVLDGAFSYAALGWPVFPVHSVTDGRCTCGSGGCASVGKHPRTEHGVTDASRDSIQIRTWWSSWPGANVGIATGAASGIVVLDIDPRHGGDDSLEELRRRYGRLPATIEALTGGGGRHLYLAYTRDAPIRNRTALAGLSGLDVRGDGGYVVAPPSLHASGQRYAWEQSSHPTERALAPIPSWLTPLIAEKSPRSQASATAGDIRAGERNSTLTSFAGTMRRRGMGEDAVAAALLAENRRRCDPPLSEDEVRRIAASVARYAPAPPGKPPRSAAEENEPDHNAFALTDLGNAERLVARHGEDLRYCDPLKTYLIWDGTRWREDDTQEVVRLAGRTVRSLYVEAEAASSQERPRKIVEHALRSEGAARIGAMLQLAQAQLTVRTTELDRDPWLFNVANGTLDLRTGEIRGHRREDHITKLAPIVYDPEACAPAWERFLERVMGGDADLIEFLRRAVGYALTGETSEQKLLLLHGTGANGKSTFLELTRALLGDYARHSDFSTFLMQRGDSVRNDIARLRGARLVTATEMEGGRALAEVVIKQLSGSDTVTARQLYAEFFEFKPTFKLFLAANHKPAIRGTDHAIWRRICLVPFRVTIPAEEQDRQLLQKLMAELAGVLAWALRGCLEWRVQGLNAPAAVLAATESYRGEMDTLGDFLGEHSVVEPAATVSAKDLYQAYAEWAAANGEKPMAKNAFGMRLGERGFIGARSSDRKDRVWNGLRLAAVQPLIKS